MSSTIRAVLLAGLTAATVVGAPLAAETPASCPECRTYENLLAPALATLEDLRAGSAQAEQDLQAWRQRASDLTGEVFSGRVPLDEMKRIAETVEWRTREAEANVELWRGAVEVQESAVRDLERARDACQRDQCAPQAEPPAGREIGALGWDRFQLSGEYVVDLNCPSCEGARDRLHELQQAGESLRAELETAREAAERASARHARLTDGLLESRPRPSDSAEDTAIDMRIHAQVLDGLRLAREEVDRAEGALQQALERSAEHHERLRAAEDELGRCQKRRCSGPAKEEEPAAGPGFGMWIGVVGGFVSWDHPEEAVQSTLDNVTFPGAVKTATTDTEDMVPGIEIGLRWPLVRGRGFTLWADGGVTVYDEAELSGTARTEVTVGGTELLSVVQFDFMTGRIIVPRVDLRLATLAGFYVEGGISYFDVPMELRIRDEFFVDGVPDVPITSVEEIDDSAVGFQAGLGWMGEHWELGVDYRQAEINDADLEVVTAHLRINF